MSSAPVDCGRLKAETGAPGTILGNSLSYPKRCLLTTTAAQHDVLARQPQAARSEAAEGGSKRLRSRAAPRIEGKLLSYYKPLLFTHTLSHENLSSQGACADFRAGFVIDKAKIRRNTVCISRIFNAVYGKDCRKDVCAPLRSQVPAWQKRRLTPPCAFGAMRSLALLARALSSAPHAARVKLPEGNFFAQPPLHFPSLLSDCFRSNPCL